MEAVDLAAYVDIMRSAIAKHRDGVNAAADDLIELAGVNEQKARQALRQITEYQGFTRRPPAKRRKPGQS